MIDTIKENVITLILALLIAGLFRTIFFQPFFIPSGSMKDNLLVGDFLFVNKMAYGYSQYSCPWAMCPFEGRILGKEPKRGDVVVFRHPTRKEDYIKRLIGLPGDEIRIVGDSVAIKTRENPDRNSWFEFPREQIEDFEEPFVPQGGARALPRCSNQPVTDGVCKKSRFEEINSDGRTYTTLEIGSPTTSGNELVYKVPEGHFFFMGDNRDNSLDSRVPQERRGVGYVPFENLVGRANLVVFSSAGSSLFFFWTWRSDRFLKAIR